MSVLMLVRVPVLIVISALIEHILEVKVTMQIWASEPHLQAGHVKIAGDFNRLTKKQGKPTRSIYHHG